MYSLSITGQQWGSALSPTFSSASQQRTSPYGQTGDPTGVNYKILQITLLTKLYIWFYVIFDEGRSLTESCLSSPCFVACLC